MLNFSEIVGKVLGNQRKTCSYKDPVLSLVPEYNVCRPCSPRKVNVLNVWDLHLV